MANIMGASTRYVVLFLLVLKPMLAQGANQSADDHALMAFHQYQALQKYHIQIVNNLSYILNVHCKSKNNNLGWHALGVNAVFDFHFRVNFQETTLFWCIFDWGNNRGGSYKVFWCGTGLQHKCNYHKCIWSARDDALYLWDNQLKNWEKYYDWKQ